MDIDDLLELPVLEVPVQCGMIRKAVIRQVTNATPYELKLTMEMLSARDEEFARTYDKWRWSWSLPQAMALRLIRHLNPGYQMKVVLE